MKTAPKQFLTPRLRAYGMLLLVSIIWGVASPIIKFTLDGFSPAVFLAYRFGISTILAIVIFAINGIHMPRDFSTVFWVLLYGFLNSVVSLGFLFFGMNNTTVLEAGLITMLEPLLISTAGVYFLNEHITKREKIGMIIAILGTGITVVGPLVANGHSEIIFSGNLLILGYVVTTLITTLIVKKLLKRDVNPMMLTNVSFIIGFLSFLGFLLYQMPLNAIIGQIVATPTQFHLGVLFMAIISGTFAFYLFNKAQKTIEIGEQSLFAYLYPVFSLPLAVIWLGEKISTIHIIGGIVIIIGVVIAESKRRRTPSIAEIKKKRYNSHS